MNMPYYGQAFPPVQPYRPVQVVQGRIVTGEGDIAPNEVAMGELPCYFPQSDGSCVIAKSWNADGTIKTTRYVPEAEEPDVTQDIIARIEALEKALKQKKQRKEASDEQQ